MMEVLIGALILLGGIIVGWSLSQASIRDNDLG